MTRPSPASPPEDLFDAIATLLEPGQREHFYQRMLYFKHLRPEDELLRLATGRTANASGGSENGSSVNFDPTNVQLRPH